MAENRIVITGGGGSGKSSLIEYLIQMGHPAIREAAREQIKKSLAENCEALPWKDVLAFSRLVQEQMKLDYDLLPNEQYCFYDRALCDVLGYLNLGEVSPYKELLDDIATFRYFRFVFVLPPWKDIFITDTERQETFEETVDAFNAIVKTYQEHGYQIVEIPKGDLEFRAEFLLNFLKNEGLEIK